MNDHRDIRRLVDAHFAGDIGMRAEQTMRRHLPECESCRQYYERHLLLAEADPQALGASERLGRGLGIRSRPRFAWTWLAAAAVATAAVAVVVWVPSGEPEFAARGEADTTLVRIYRMGADDVPAPVADRMSADDELAFAYQNPTGEPRLLLFAVHESGAVYWYAPTWSEPQANPVAVSAATGAGFHELPKATRHALTPGRLWLYLILTERELAVREVEAMLAGVERGAELPVGANQEIVPLTVTP